MASTLRKCINLRPEEPGPNGEAASANDYRVVRSKFTGSGTRWVKLWARWNKIQQQNISPRQLGNPAVNTLGYRYVRALDEQIAAARADGLGVILTIYQFPAWLNGTAGVTEHSAADYRLQPENRMTRANFEAANASITSASSVVPARYQQTKKPLAFGLPPLAQMGVDGAFGGFVRFLYERYMQYGTNFVLEVMNEPNQQWWPQQGPSASADAFGAGPPTVQDYIGQAMRTAQAIHVSLGRRARIAGPGLADSAGPGAGAGRLLTNYTVATPSVLTALERNGFVAESAFIWSHHNYVDTATGRDVSGKNRTTYLRDLLAGRWAGWHGERADVPNLWLTEGGFRITAETAAQYALQAQRVSDSWAGKNQSGGDGAGVEMFSNYALYSDPNYNTGLLSPLYADGSGGGVRDVWGRWQGFPGRL